MFIPLSGDNDAGVADSITYQDPLGEYMEIKNGAIEAPAHEGEGTYDMALLLFGEMHGLVRVGVYDYQWNDKYMSAHEGEDGVGKHGENIGVRSKKEEHRSPDSCIIELRNKTQEEIKCLTKIIVQSCSIWNT